MTVRTLSTRIDDSTARLSARVQSRLAAHAGDDRADAGMTTAEYAVGTVAACGVAGVLIEVLKAPTFKEFLTGLIKGAFKHLF